MSSNGHIVVIGSINMDLVCRAKRLPEAGETVLGNDFQAIPGGKGANQSVAAAKLANDGLKVYHVGRVGSDDLGQRLFTGLQAHGVQTDHVVITEGMSSGVAMILVEKNGENRIIVAPGANAKVSPADVDRAEPLIKDAAAVVMQLEIPFATVRHAIAMCQRHGVFTILDPAPAPIDGMPRAMFGVDIISPNQAEAKTLIGNPGRPKVKRKTVVDPKQIAIDLLARGPKNVVLKLGSKGSILVDGDGHIERFAGHKVKVEDTTAAGDAFTAALAVGRAEGKSLADSIRFANAAGALCCTKFGAQPALPGREDVDALLAKKVAV
jgi:ribokinase